MNMQICQGWNQEFAASVDCFGGCGKRDFRVRNSGDPAVFDEHEAIGQDLAGIHGDEIDVGKQEGDSLIKRWGGSGREGEEGDSQKEKGWRKYEEFRHLRDWT